MKNIAILSSCLTRGGAEHAAGELSVHMAECSNVYIFLLENKPITYNYQGTIVQLKFEEYYSELRKKPFGFLLSKYAYIKTIKDIKRLKREYNIDSCVSFLETLNMMNILSKGQEEVYVSVRNNRSMQNDTKLHKFENWFIRHFYKKADGVISLSYGCTEDLAGNFSVPKEKIKTIYNYFDIEGIKKRATDAIPEDIERIIKGKRVVLSMGRYVKQKNFEQLIDVMCPIVERYDDVILIILGRGPLREQLQDIITRKKVNNKMFLIDYLPNPMPLIKRANVFVMNSIFEGLCNSIVEAMICGTLTVSTDFKFGAREMIADMRDYQSPITSFKVFEKGILVPVGNTEEMRNAIVYAIEHENELSTCTQNAQNYFDDSFNDSVDEKWRRLLKVNE